MRAWVLLVLRMPSLEGKPKVSKVLLISWIDFWVILKSGYGIRDCVVFPFDLYSFWGIFL
jgi:hypothetical protein